MTKEKTMTTPIDIDAILKRSQVRRSRALSEAHEEPEDALTSCDDVESIVRLYQAERAYRVAIQAFHVCAEEMLEASERLGWMGFDSASERGEAAASAADEAAEALIAAGGKP